jgi:RNA polymerase sigma factor (sigma-70 family)
LLRQYVERGSSEAFGVLVERHPGMLHGAALRVVRDESRAEEITQAVFIILARKAASLRRGTILAGWLYRTAHFVALDALRAERRRQQHLSNLAQLNDSSQTGSVWDQIAPLLEEAMDRLGDTERDAVVLRFFEQKSFAEVASALGTSEAAAKMRIGRALERLRNAFARRGVAVSATVLFAALSAHGAPTVPAGLSATVVTAALAQEAAVNSSLITLVKGGLKIMAWTKMKSSVAAGAIVLLLAGGAVVVQQQVSRSGNTWPMFVAGFEPMAGEWEGTYELRGDGLPTPMRQTAALTIRATEQGRSCEIEMRVIDAAGQLTQSYRFTHALDRTGHRIITVDDPQVGRITGEGVVTESINDPARGEWVAAFRAPHRNGGGLTECRWICRGDELIIARRDQNTSPQGTSHLYSDLKLRRRAAAKATP